PSDVEAFRKRAHHPATHVRLEVSAVSRPGPGIGKAPRTLLDRRWARRGGEVRGAMLDAARLAASSMGAGWIVSGGTAVRDSQLLDEQLLGRGWGSVWGGACVGCVPPGHVPTAG